MSIARSTIALLGTDESTGVTIANNATTNGSEVDVLGDDTSSGALNLFLVYTSGASTGSLDVRINPRRVSGQSYAARNFQWTQTPNGVGDKLFLGTVQASRYMTADVKNNATGASATNVAVLGELHKVS